MSKSFDGLMTQLGIHPVLVDVGASGSPLDIWKPIAAHSIYVGFDPDSREMREDVSGIYYKEHIVNEAVAKDPGEPYITFYLTKSPYCSSTLKPDMKVLEDYLFYDLFNIEKDIRVKATTLDDALARLALPGIDWLKLDTQGTDLRIFKSLTEQIRARVLAVDIEPGLISDYQGDDTFSEAHDYLTRNGFWLSSLPIKGPVRIKRATFEELRRSDPTYDRQFLESAIRQSPLWCEARYLRTLEWLHQNIAERRGYIVLWLFALLEEQIGFALDIAREYSDVFGRDEVSELLWNEPLMILERIQFRHKYKTAFSILSGLASLRRSMPQPIRSTLKNLVSRR